MAHQANSWPEGNMLGDTRRAALASFKLRHVADPRIFSSRTLADSSCQSVPQSSVL